MTRWGLIVSCALAWGSVSSAQTDPASLMSAFTYEPAQGRIVANTGLGLATEAYDAFGAAAPYGGDVRYLQILSGFEGRIGLYPNWELGVQIPLFFSVYSNPLSVTLRQSGGGLGDVKGWLKIRWLELEGFSSAVWGGVKWPTGKWTGLDALKFGTDKTGTGSQDLFGGLILSYAWEWASFHVNATYSQTGPKSYLDSVGNKVEQDDGEITDAAAGVVVKAVKHIDVALPLLYQNVSRVYQNGVRVDNSDMQWLALRPSLLLQVTPEAMLEPAVEFPLRGVNRQKTLTFSVFFHYQY